MSIIQRTLAAALIVANATHARSQTPAPLAATREVAAYKRDPGPLEPVPVDMTWRDESRQRDVPVRVWLPKEGDGPFPVIVFSHGLGGTRDGYAYLGKHWASYGYACVHVQHAGSDDAVWRDNPRAMEAMQEAAASLDNLTNRPADIRFAIDELARLQAKDGPPLGKRLDLERIGVAGHSFGAYTALCAAGRDLVGPAGNKLDVGDPRVKACLAMSPQGKEHERKNGTWAEVGVPCFHMTGTKDSSPIRNDATPKERRIPFDAIEHAEQYLLILDGGTHMTFSDTGFGGMQRPSAHWPVILSSSTAFWDAHLKGDAKALAWLRDGDFAALLGKQGTFEHKSPAASAPATR